MIEIIKRYKYELFLAVVVIGVVLFSLCTLTTRPRLWTDESISIELARNFMTFGKLNLMVAPDKFFEAPFFLQSTGYPMTMLLALFFKIFGFGVVQARLFALLLMVICLIAVFQIVKKIFNSKHAIASVLLISTFAPFYGNGRCITGEILGFIFLLLGLYLALYKDKFLYGGLFIGLAVVTKPSVYLLSVLAIFIVFLFDWKKYWKKMIVFASGAVPAALIWIFLFIPVPFRISDWMKIFTYYKNPFGATSIGQSVISNLINWPQSTTLLYFSALFLLIVASFFVDKRFFKTQKNLFIFTVSYVSLSFLYYLKSPGWLRYLMAAELLIFVVLSPVMEAIVDKCANSAWGRKKDYIYRNKSKIFYAAIFFLVIIQLFQLAFKADMFYSTASLEIIDYLNQQPADKTIGFINSSIVSSLVKVDQKYQIIANMIGLPAVGDNFFISNESRLPDLLVANPEEKFLKDNKKGLEANYKIIYSNDNYNVYSRK